MGSSSTGGGIVSRRGGGQVRRSPAFSGRGAMGSCMAPALSFAMNDESDRRFELLIVRNRGMVERFFKRRDCTADVAADLVQDTMELIWRKRADFRGGDVERSFRGWAIKIARTVWV